MTFEIEWTKTAEKMLEDIRDARIQKQIIDKVEYVAKAPMVLGKRLTGNLEGYYSIHAGRYRVLYQIDADRIIVVIVAVGIRKEGSKRDIYRRAVRVLKTIKKYTQE